MKKLIAFIFCCFFSVTAFSQTNKGLQITRLKKNFYVYTTWKKLDGAPFPANALYVVTDSGVILIDTPWDTTQFQPLVDSIRIKHHKKIVLCISTHSHSDRTAGLEFIRQHGAKTYTTFLTDTLSIKDNDKRAEFHFTGDTTFTIGEYSFQTYFPGEGHTKDNIVVWFSKDKILYGGCLIKSVDATNIGYIDDANIKAWPSTINNLKQKFPNPAFIITGHQDWTNKKSLDHTLYLLQQYKKKS
jgi:metallo-beta-lactamase class B